MPELPEVETIRKSLQPHILRKKIEKVFIGEKKLRWEINRKPFQEIVEGQIIVSLSRRSKYLIWELSNGAHVIFHLGMSGRLGVFNQKVAVEIHTHLIFYLSDDLQVRFRDPRRFGFVEVLSPEQKLSESERLKSLGPEPLSDEFNAEHFSEIILKSVRPIKLVIMDARIVVGVGNIYANEALFFAGILPDSTANSLTKIKVAHLVKSIKSVLLNAIDKGGTTLKDFENANGEPGYFQQDLKVYGRAGKPCYKCGTVIKKNVLGQRSTFFCDSCQK